MQEVNAEPIQVGVKLRESVEPGFDFAPIVIARPIFADFLHVIERNPWSAAKRLKLTSGDRVLWICLSRLWRDWRSALAIVKPETVLAWHRAGFRLFWTWKVRHGQPGRPVISREARDLIRKMCRDNPTWGAPRIHGELLKLGINIAESSVSKYMLRCHKPPSQSWRTFLENHTQQLVSIDFFTVPTIRFQVFYVFLVLAHDRRRILHFNVTAHPTAEWTGQQPREAFPFAQLPRYLLRDRDAIHRLPEKAKNPLRYALYLLGSLKFTPKLSLWVVHIGEFRSSDSGRAASRLSLRFVLKIRLPQWAVWNFREGTVDLGVLLRAFFH